MSTEYKLKENTQDTLADGSDTEDEAETETETANEKAKRLAREKSQTMMKNKRISSQLLTKRAIDEGIVSYR